MVSIDNLSSEIARQVALYTSDVEKKVRNAENKVAREAVDQLKMTSPVGNSEEKKYADGWTRKRTEHGIVIYNRNKPGLAHLLEKGHAKAGGGRVPGKLHIRPAEDRAVTEFEKLVEKAIKQ